jgi:hypothetical protein
MQLMAAVESRRLVLRHLLPHENSNAPGLSIASKREREHKAERQLDTRARQHQQRTASAFALDARGLLHIKLQAPPARDRQFQS